jgi:hypothetical protein
MGLWVAALGIASTTLAAGKPEAIEIRQRNGAYELTVPASRLVAIIPRGDLVLQENSQARNQDPGYFFLEDKAQGLIVSGWFEPDPDLPSLQTFWEGQTKQWRDMGLPKPQAVSFARISDWDAIIYDVALPSGSNSHIRARWVQAGTWIDLHLSITAERPSGECRKLLKAALKAIRVREKE